MTKQTNRTAVMGAILVANFLAAMEVTIVGTAMPTIVGALQGLNLFSWVVTGYLLSQSITVPIYGKLADLYGRKRVFLAGAAIFLLGSLLSGLAQSMTQLVIARIIQGVGGGAILPVSVTLVGDLFPGKERGRAQGLTASVWGVASVLGPLLGVAIVSLLGWRWVFFINLPVGLLAMGAIWLSLHEDVKPNPHGLDFPGALLLAGGVGLLLYALRFSGGSVFNPTMLGLLGTGVILLMLFIWHERRAPEPLLPLHLFQSRLITVSTVAAFLSGFPLMAITVFIPLFVQGALGGTPANSGAVLSAMSVSWSATAFISGRWLYGRIGYRWGAVIGTALIALGSLLTALLTSHTSLAFVAATGSVIGIGFGLSMSAFIITVQESVGWSSRGVATAVQQFGRNLGTAVGAAVLGTVLNNQLVPRLGQIPALAGQSEQARLELANAVLEPGALKQLPPEVLAGMQGALASGLQSVFLVVVVVAGAGLAVTLLLPASRAGLAGEGSGGGSREQLGQSH